MAALVRRGVTLPVCWTRACGIIQKLHCEPTYKCAVNGSTTRTFHALAPISSDGFRSIAAQETNCNPAGTWNVHYRQYCAKVSKKNTKPETKKVEKPDSGKTIKSIYYTIQENFIQKHVSGLVKKMDNGKVFSSDLETVSFITLLQQLDTLYWKANDEQKANFCNCEITQKSLDDITDNVCGHTKIIPITALIELLCPLDNFEKMSKALNAAAQAELNERIETVSMKEAFGLLKVLIKKTGNPEEDELYKKAVVGINRNITEMSFGKDMVTAMFLIYDHHPEVKGIDVPVLEEKLAEAAQFMDAKNLYTVLYLSAKGRRRTHLVLTCSHFLLSKEWRFTETELSNLFFVYSSLHLRHIEFASKLTEQLCKVLNDRKRTINHKLCLGIIKSCSLSNWNDSELLGQLVKNVLDNKRLMSNENLALFPLSLGSLSLKDFDKDALLAIEEPIRGFKLEKPHLWLKFVWSLCMMQIATVELAQSVTEANFSTSILQSVQAEPVHKQVATNNMLLNIWAYYIHELGGKFDNTFTETVQSARNINLVMENVMTSTSSSSAINQQVQEVLAKISMSGKCINKTYMNKFGYKADFELFVNSDGLPVPLIEKATNKQVLIKVVNFKDMLFSRHNPPEPTGRVAMAIRHLQTRNNAVITITYKDWEQVPTANEKVVYLEDQLKKAVNSV